MSFIGGMILLSEDHIYPLLSSEWRSWRKTARTEVNKLVQIRFASSNDYFVILKNFSQEGLSLTGFESEFPQEFKEGETIKFQLKINGVAFQIHDNITKKISQMGSVYLGIQTLGPMPELITNLKPQKFPFFPSLLKKSEIKKLICLLWVTSTASSFLVPSCGEQKSHQEESMPRTNPLTVSFGYEQGFYFVGPITDYKIKIEGCRSGFTKEVAMIDSAQIRIPLGDQGCVAILSEITHDNELYLADDPFNPDVDARTLFVNQNSSQQMFYVTVVSQLSAKITAHETVSFKIASYEQGILQSLLGPVLTEIELSASVSQVSEGDEKMSLTLHRNSFLNYPIHVNLKYSGSAISGEDYQNLPTTVTIPSNRSDTTLDVLMIENETPEIDKELIVETLPGVGYYGHSQVGVVLKDNDFTIKDTGQILRLSSDSGFSLAPDNHVKAWKDIVLQVIIFQI